MSKNKPELAKLISSKPAGDSSKWIGLKKLTYQDPNGRVREWESAERLTRSEGGVDGVGILAILRYANKPDEILLQKQFRPPVEGVCIEMPAGLIDGGESIEIAALRELKEETGYVGDIINSSPIIFNDPGFTNTNLSLVTVIVDMSLPENQNPVSELEENEFIECFTVPLASMAEEMAKLDKQGYKLDARVQNVAQGIKIAQDFKL
ncbi:unnamed protein product [Kluyveromyces dobzhanskii CBS 2104]|uniref:WGS project CCBQ000000000 data, contig 00053 n=1 Tax=Kluyveromyces dobzhanskii CBS 2104 TaxID=1427455 RepID=A0A0A8L2H8_9SACH|nr:unnamed protein product [Kluyveromyces dobzhanskii CBS 2104]